MPAKVFLNACVGSGPPALPLNYRKINWQTVGVGFRTAAQVADGNARRAGLINDSGILG